MTVHSDIVRARILAAEVDPIDAPTLVATVLRWARRRESRYVCFGNAHMMLEAVDHRDFRPVMRAADLVLPDGRPLVWMLRKLGWPRQQHVRGPAAMKEICAAAAREGVPVGFFGSTEEVLAAIVSRARRDFPGIDVAYAYSPPFRALTADEDAEIVARLEQSGVAILFVGLGCPKQERWMFGHKGRVRAVMLGVGQGFDLYAGRFPECPEPLSRLGLEGFYRILHEPRRLARRNLAVPPRFAVRAVGQLLGLRRPDSD